MKAVRTYHYFQIDLMNLVAFNPNKRVLMFETDYSTSFTSFSQHCPIISLLQRIVSSVSKSTAAPLHTAIFLILAYAWSRQFSLRAWIRIKVGFNVCQLVCQSSYYFFLLLSCPSLNVTLTLFPFLFKCSYQIFVRYYK